MLPLFQGLKQIENKNRDILLNTDQETSFNFSFETIDIFRNKLYLISQPKEAHYHRIYKC